MGAMKNLPMRRNLGCGSMERESEMLRKVLHEFLGMLANRVDGEIDKLNFCVRWDKRDQRIC